MSGNEFRVGQRVVCVDASDVEEWIAKGSTYTISAIEKSEPRGDEHVWVKEDAGHTFRPHHFTPAPLPPIGSRVRVTEEHHVWSAGEVATIVAHEPHTTLRIPVDCRGESARGLNYALDSTKVALIPEPEPEVAPVVPEVGRAYRVTFDGWTGLAFSDGYMEAAWRLVRPAGERQCVRLEDVTDVRPLVVLDLGAVVRGDWAVTRSESEILVELRDDGWDSIADQIEAQIKPPRIEEPGLQWAVVEASTSSMPRERTRFGRICLGGWTREGDGCLWDWADLINPTLIRPGIEDRP